MHNVDLLLWFKIYLLCPVVTRVLHLFVGPVSGSARHVRTVCGSCREKQVSIDRIGTEGLEEYLVLVIGTFPFIIQLFILLPG